MGRYITVIPLEKYGKHANQAEFFDLAVQRKKFTPSLAKAKDYIYNSLDLSSICKKLIDIHQWKKSDTDTISLMYQNYLYLISKYGNQYPHPLPPSLDIDEFWHEHILSTEQYKADCTAIFGKYLEHYPYLGIDEKSNTQDLLHYFEKTQELYKKEFGDYIYVIRGKLSKIVSFTKRTLKGD